MYVVKAGGKAGFAIFDPAMPSEIRGRHELATELQQAVDLDQLELRYQPIVNLQTGAMAGFEALVRWRHPERGLIAPGQFIEIAEEHGSILPIGRWVLREACRQVAAWSAEGSTAPGMYVGVNVSAREVQETDFVEGVREALNDHGVDASALVIEITETALLRATPATIAALTALNHLGVRVVIDNFGSGYFSLSHLRQFPVHALKIAREFTQEIDDDTDARTSASRPRSSRWRGRWASRPSPRRSRRPPKPTGCARSAARTHRASTSTGRCSPRSCRRWPATRSSRSPRRPPKPRPPPRSRAPGAGAAEKRPRRLRTSPTSSRRPIRCHDRPPRRS